MLCKRCSLCHHTACGGSHAHVMKCSAWLYQFGNAQEVSQLMRLLTSGPDMRSIVDDSDVAITLLARKFAQLA